MITDISLIVKPEDEHCISLIRKMALEALSLKGIQTTDSSLSLVFLRKSIDARHGQVKLCLRYKAYIGESPDAAQASRMPVWKKAEGKHRIIIIGSGPAGLFGAFRLLEAGIRPIIIERGEETVQRKSDIARISTKGEVGGDSNYCFGEGGAGTFSDGKLYTRSNKRGDIGRILRIFTAFGADSAIQTDAHPHIGTDKLPAIVNAMRAKITELGGEFHFATRCTGFMTDPAHIGENSESSRQTNAIPIITGVTTLNTKTGEVRSFSGDAVVLASGHSASDIYELLAKTVPTALEAKTFAIGVRVEHPRKYIDKIQYHGRQTEDLLPTAEYKLTGRENGRGVYSFCMCPGGFVVPAATGPDEIVVNGMSAAARNSKWSNAAIVVETLPEDIPVQFRELAQKAGCPALAGLYFRTWLEKETKRHGKGQAAPAQRLSDFLNGRDSETLPESSYAPGVVASRLDQWIPDQITRRLAKGFRDFDKNMKGYICPEALLIAMETRTSTPVRILRNKETFESPAIQRLYPTGEGSGYSGGIVSSAMDGENVCTAVIHALGETVS